jgi:hypothetical protein
MKHDTAGDPMSELKWTRKTTEKVARELARAGIHVSASTVRRLLKKMGYSLRVNHKKQSGKSSPGRDQQFKYIARMKSKFARAACPIISVDTKKKEMIGNFKNNGATWEKSARRVKDHDFLSDAEGRAIPYGVFDPTANLASVFVGVSADTAEFAAESIEKWWRFTGSRSYPGADRLLLLADGGGSNGSRNRAWKVNLQEILCDRHRLTVTVCHYPTGTSKWNPIEHRLFSYISKNWAGQPLNSYDTVLNYLRTTRTKTGLKVKAYLVRKDYHKGVRISKAEMKSLAITRHKTQPERNYTLRPR